VNALAFSYMEVMNNEKKMKFNLLNTPQSFVDVFSIHTLAACYPGLLVVTIACQFFWFMNAG